jgi:hypothetical protein
VVRTAPAVSYALVTPTRRRDLTHDDQDQEVAGLVDVRAHR